MFFQTAVIVSAVFASACISIAVIGVHHYRGRRPSWVPFAFFKLICRFGITSSVEVLSDWSPGVFAFSYGDDRYCHWRDELIRRKRITAKEWMALDSQMYEEQECARLEQTRACLNALREKQLELKNQGGQSDR